MKSLYGQIKEAGIPCDWHESDLYFELNETSQKILDVYQFKKICTRFTIEGKIWIDVPFAYDPFWDHKAEIARKYYEANPDKK